HENIFSQYAYYLLIKKQFIGCTITDDDIDDRLKKKWIKALEQCDNEDKDMIEDFI
ncbi:41108_t:CDS:2, partial [Gigaspora margarita]